MLVNPMTGVRTADKRLLGEPWHDRSWLRRESSEAVRAVGSGDPERDDLAVLGRAAGLVVILLMDKILHDLNDSKLWELWYIPYNG